MPLLPDKPIGLTVNNKKIKDWETELKILKKQISEKDEVINILKKPLGILSKP